MFDIFHYGRVYSIVSDFTQTHVLEALAVHRGSNAR